MSSGFLTGVKADNSVILKGETSIQKSIEASRNVNSNTVVFASADSFADSLSAINLTNRLAAKLIVVDKNISAKDLEEYCKKNNISKAYIIGGNETFAKNYENIIKKSCSNTTRLSGTNRYETNKTTLKEVGFTNVALADGRNFPDALSSSPLLKSKDLGLLLVNGSKDYRFDIKGYEVKYIFGGFDSVKHYPTWAKRIGGYDRYATNFETNKELGTEAKNIILADSRDFREALIANNFVNATNEKVNITLCDSKSNSVTINESGPYNNVYYMSKRAYTASYKEVNNTNRPKINLYGREEQPVDLDSMGQKSTSYETQGWLLIKGYEFRIGKNYGREGTYSLAEAQEYIDGHNIYSKWNALDNNDGKGSYIISHGYLIEMASQDMRLGDQFSVIDINGNKNTYKIVRFNRIPKSIFDMRDIYDAQTNEMLGNNLLETKESYILSFCQYQEVAYAYAEKIK